MAKVGQSGQTPQRPEDAYNKDLQGNIARFEAAFSNYSKTGSPAEKAHLKTIMDGQMSMIQANVREIKRSGIEKQGKIVESSYDKFLKKPDDSAARTALQQNMDTLKEYGYTSE